MNASLVSGLLDNTELYDVMAPTVISGLAAANDGPTLVGRPTALTTTVAAGSHVSSYWALGDGESGEGAEVAHIYLDAGVYAAVVTDTNPVSTQSAVTEATVIVPERVFLPIALLDR